MKKLMIAFVCSIGVGLAMMASPAQVCDDNNAVAAQGGNSVHSVIGKSVTHGRNLIKHEWKMKKIDFSKVNAPRRIGYGWGSSDPLTKDTTRFRIITKTVFIISDPVPGPPIIRPNGPFPKPGGNGDVLRSGHHSSGSPSGRPNEIRPGQVVAEINTFDGVQAGHIIHDPVPVKDKDGNAHTNGYSGPDIIRFLDK